MNAIKGNTEKSKIGKRNSIIQRTTKEEKKQPSTSEYGRSTLQLGKYWWISGIPKLMFAFEKNSKIIELSAWTDIGGGKRLLSCVP